MQLILVLETRSSCNSDYRYIKATIDYYYKQRTFNINPIYAKTKSELVKQDKRVQEEINRYNGYSKVVLCADYDSDSSPENIVIVEYCKKHDYELIWMNTNIEHVYLNKPNVDDKDKESRNFLRKSKIILKNLQNLHNLEPLDKPCSSNILVVLDKYLERK